MTSRERKGRRYREALCATSRFVPELSKFTDTQRLMSVCREQRL